MIKIMADNDVQGQFARLLQICRSEQWHEVWQSLNVVVESFPSLGLTRESSDLAVWQTCQLHQVILITGNRNQEGPDSLESTLRTFNQETSLPVVTIAAPGKVNRSQRYAERAAERLLDILLDLEAHKGAGRLYVP